jgi:hypothetical protein
MPRLALPLLGIACALVVPALAQVQPPEAPPSGDQTSPALLEMIRQHLAQTSGLRPADGVRIDESRFYRGDVRIRGTLRAESQRAALRRELESIRTRLEMAVDVKITMFDLTGLRISATPPSGQPSKEAPKPRLEEIVEEDVMEVFPAYRPFVAPPVYYMPSGPQIRQRCHLFHRNSEYDGPPGGYGPPPMYNGWYGPPPMPYGYPRFYYPY